MPTDHGSLILAIHAGVTRLCMKGLPETRSQGGDRPSPSLASMNANIALKIGLAIAWIFCR